MQRRRLHPVQSHSNDDEPRQVALLRRARRHVVRGEAREAMLAVKEACFSAGDDARLWALYGAHCWRARRHADAAEALRQAIFLRGRDAGDRRVAVLKALLAAVEEGGAPRSTSAA